MKRVGLGLLLSAALHAGALLTASSFGHEQVPTVAAPAAESAPLELVRVDVLGAAASGAESPPPAAPAPDRAARARPRPSRAAVVTTEAPAPEPAPLSPDSSPAASVPSEAGSGPEDQPTTAAGSGEGVTGNSSASGRPGGAAQGSGIGTGTGGQAPGSDLDAQQRARLHARLSEAARQCYPPAARRFRLTGEVLLSICLDGRGGFHSVQTLQASGSDLLDRAAIECVLPKAAPLPGPATCLRIPVQFRQDR